MKHMRVGDDALFMLNDDAVVSPAVVINTVMATDLEVLAMQAPKMPEGSHYWTPNGVVRVGEQVIYIQPPSNGHVDLLVHGLVRDYRVYDVPVRDAIAPGSCVPKGVES